MRNVLDLKKYNKKLQEIVAMSIEKEHGVDIHFDNAAMAISLANSRTEVLSALKKDVEKSIDALSKVQKIITSIVDGEIIEFKDEEFNKVEDVFGELYNKETNQLTLYGVSYDLNSPIEYSKKELREIIWKEIFDLDSKEVSATIKSVEKYESTNDLIDKAVLYPSIDKSTEILQKVTEKEIAFNKFQQDMDLDSRQIYDRVSKRSGVDTVMLDSTYIDVSGVKQISNSHTKDKADNLFKVLETHKYIEAIEIDPDGDLDKAIQTLEQINKFNLNVKNKFTYKYRKLGNHNANGLCIPGKNMVLSDPRNTSAIIHEIAHLIHILYLIDNEFIIELQKELYGKIDFKNIDLPEEKLENILKKKDYYLDEYEIVARALEISALIAQEKGLLSDSAYDIDLISSQKFYKEREGIYFNFTSFTDEEKDRMLDLYNLFYETGPEMVIDSRIDNYIQHKKIERENSLSTEKSKSILEILMEEQRKDEKEQRKLFALVNKDTIESIFANKDKSVSIKELSTAILFNLRYTGDFNKSMTAEDWGIAAEDRSTVSNFIFDKLKNDMSNKDYVDFLFEFKKSQAWRSIKSSVLLNGFQIKWQIRIKNVLKEQEFGDTNFNKMKEFESNIMNRTPLLLADLKLLLNEEYMKDILSKNPSHLEYLKYHEDFKEIPIEILKNYTLFLFEETKQPSVIPSYLNNDKDIVLLKLTENPSYIYSVSNELKNNKEFMTDFLKNIGNPTDHFGYIGEELKKDLDFVLPYVKENPEFIKICDSSIKKDLGEKLKINNSDIELAELAKNPKTNYKRKIARETIYPEVLEVLAKDKNYDIRMEVAKRDICPPHILTKLSKLKNEYVCHYVGSNKNTPLSDLKKLAGRDNDWILQGVALNENLPLSLAKSFSKESHRGIQGNLFLNPKISNMRFGLNDTRKILSEAFKDNEEYILLDIMKNNSRFNPSVEFLLDMKKNPMEYIKYDSGYRDYLVEYCNKKIEEIEPNKEVIKAIEMDTPGL